tara:strand:+ start:913 stop:1812 length:900 start_codon:yes stop_codon:yes gene_type:complete
MSYALLEKACSRCKPSSIRTYWANIKALSKVAGHDETPAGAGWLSGKLLSAIRAMPLNRFKRFATAGVKAAQMYKVKKPAWNKAAAEASERYSRVRETGKRTKREAQNWPQDGYRALAKLASELHTELQHLEKKKTWTNSDLYHYQRYLIVLFYSKHALRGDLADVRHKKPYGPNWIQPDGKAFKMHIGEHKTSRAHGPIRLSLGPEISAALRTFLPQLRRLTTHGYLLSTLRTGNRLQRQDMLRLIRNTTKQRLNKNIGVQLIRVLKVTGAQLQIDAAKKLQQEMGHSASMQRKYISR